MALNASSTATPTGSASAVDALLASASRGGLMGRTGAGELLSQYTRSINELIAQENNPGMKAFNIIPVDAGSAGVSMSCIVQVLQYNGRAFMYTYLLEGTVPALGTRTIKSGNNNAFGVNQQEVTIPYVPGDLYKQTYIDAVSKYVANQLNIDAKTVVDSGAAVIYSEVQPAMPNVPDDVSRFRQLIWAGTNAVVSAIILTSPDRTDFTTDELKGRRVHAHLEFMNSAVIDESGLPVRAGYSIETYATSGSDADIATNGHDSLVQVTGYVDIMQLSKKAAEAAFAARFGMNPAYAPVLAAQAPVARFAPHVICTLAQSNQSVMSMNILLFALAQNALIINKDNKWRHALAPRYNDRYHSLAGLSHELGVLIDPADTAFNLAQFLDANLLPTPALSMHIPKVGPSAHLWSLLITACNPTDPGHAKAKEFILASANSATKGAFGRLFSAGGAIGFVQANIVPMGYYIDPETQAKRSLDDVDHLCVANLSGDVNTICAYEDAKNFESSVSVERRLADTLAILNELLEGKYRLKGWKQLVTFNPEFIIALWEAFRSEIGGIRLDNAHEAIEEVERGVSGMGQYFINTSLLQNNQSVFGFGGQNQNNAFGQRNMFSMF